MHISGAAGDCGSTVLRCRLYVPVGFPGGNANLFRSAPDEPDCTASQQVIHKLFAVIVPIAYCSSRWSASSAPRSSRTRAVASS
eukprot:3086322-Pyramimonas_sp.AAC.1